MEKSSQVSFQSVPKRAGTLVPRKFFEDSPERVAPKLLGKLLVHRTQGAVSWPGGLSKSKRTLDRTTTCPILQRTPIADQHREILSSSALRDMPICISSTAGISAQTSAASARDWAQASCCEPSSRCWVSLRWHGTGDWMRCAAPDDRFGARPPVRSARFDAPAPQRARLDQQCVPAASPRRRLSRAEHRSHSAHRHKPCRRFAPAVCPARKWVCFRSEEIGRLVNQLQPSLVSTIDSIPNREELCT